MNNHSFSISEFAIATGGHYLDNDIMIAKIDQANNYLLNSIIEDMLLSRIREDISIALFVHTGEAVATLDYRTYTAKNNAILNIPPFRILTQCHVDNNFSGYLLIFSKDLIEETAFNRKPPVSITQLISVDKSPCRNFSKAENDVLKTCLDRIYYYLKHKEHRLRKELIINTFYTFILEVANIVFDETKEKAPAEKSIKKVYIQKFIELLVKHADKEHNPAFYADKLCISVQYLSIILKEVSGRTANTWIASYIVTRAKTMLRKPDMTIQQITEALNFSDQSSFGKFFKKHVGSSPKKYRENHIIY
ncbi:MAG: AraC family transcriptional regulator [Bacteroidales bacterium]|nr:AraC family transcriptional regulator [Bacteroidales bacterium]